MNTYGLIQLNEETKKGFVGVSFEDTIMQDMVRDGVTGVIIQEQQCDYLAQAIAEWFSQRGIEVIWWVNYFQTLTRPWMARLNTVTRDVAFGYETPHVFTNTKDPVGLFKRLKEVEKHRGVRWWCPLSLINVVTDIRDAGPLHDIIGSTRTPCFFPGGHVLLAYLNNDLERFPGVGQSSVYGLNLSDDYGVDRDAVADYVRSLEVITTVGGQPGINAGAVKYAEDVGINNFMVTYPVDRSNELPKTDDEKSYPETVE